MWLQDCWLPSNEQVPSKGLLERFEKAWELMWLYLDSLSEMLINTWTTSNDDP